MGYLTSQLLQICVACHMNTAATGVPYISGQSKTYLMQQLRDYRSEKRKHAIMNLQTKHLTDEQIDYLAEYFSWQSCSK